MYPNLYFAIKDLFGLDLPFLQIFQSFGVMVAVSFLLSAWLFSKELKRKEDEGFLRSSTIKTLKGAKVSNSVLIFDFILGFILGYKLLYIALNFSAFSNDTQGFILSTQGNWLGGLIVGGWMAYSKYRESEKQRLPEPIWVETQSHPYQLVGNMTLIAAVSGILGAKVFHNLENWDEFIANPISALLSFSGLTMYGGLICGSIAVLYFAKKNKLSLLHVMDACAPGLMLAYGTGRIGCHVSGDGDWGIDNLAPKPAAINFLPDWVWSYSYPHNVNSIGVPIPGCMDEKYCNMLPNPVFPTAFYEAVACIFLFFVLWSLRKRIKTAGVLFGVYLIFNGVERFFIEKIRVNTTYDLFGNHITQAELISTVLFLLGVIGIVVLNRKKKQQL